MPLFAMFNVEAAAAEAKAHWDHYCDQYMLLDGEPFETGPEWIYIEIQGEAPEHNLPCWPYEGKTFDKGLLYLPCLNLRTGITIHVRMSEFNNRPPPNKFAQGGRFKTIEWLDNAMEVIAWASL